MPNSLVAVVVTAAAAIIVIAIVARILSGRRDATERARRREELRRQHGYLYMQQQEMERLAARIVATSSTQSIAGFELVRQVEAVFTDGHGSPAAAVGVLKALAAEKGANAIVNLASERLPSGKCQARGDAVVVKSAAPATGETKPT